MCLAIPMQIKTIDGVNAVVNAGGVEKGIRVDLVPHARTGDYVLVHAGFAIAVVDEAEAKQTIDYLMLLSAEQEA